MHRLNDLHIFENYFLKRWDSIQVKKNTDKELHIEIMANAQCKNLKLLCVCVCAFVRVINKHM